MILYEGKLVGSMKTLKELVRYYGDIDVSLIITGHLSPNQQNTLRDKNIMFK